MTILENHRKKQPTPAESIRANFDPLFAARTAKYSMIQAASSFREWQEWAVSGVVVTKDVSKFPALHNLIWNLLWAVGFSVGRCQLPDTSVSRRRAITILVRPQTITAVWRTRLSLLSGWRHQGSKREQTLDFGTADCGKSVGAEHTVD